LPHMTSSTPVRRVAGRAGKNSRPKRRGFELFSTEYDPRRGQFGADCFHCTRADRCSRARRLRHTVPTAVHRHRAEKVTGKASDRDKFAVPSLRNCGSSPRHRCTTDASARGRRDPALFDRRGRSATWTQNVAKHPDGACPLCRARGPIGHRPFPQKP